MVLPFLAIAAFLLWGRFYTVYATGFKDAQLFDYIGGQLLHGAVLYVDVWDIKPPGIFYINALLNSISEETFWPHAGAELLALIMALIAVWFIVREIADKSSALFAVVLLSALSAMNIYNEGGNLTEIYVMALSAVAAAVFICGYRLPICLILTGTTVALATLFKLSGLSVLICIVVYLSIESIKFRTFRHSFITFIYISIGFLLVWGVAVLAHPESWMEMLRVSFVYPFEYGKGSHTSVTDTYSRFVHKTSFVWSFLIFIFPCVCLAIQKILRKEISRESLLYVFIAGWALCDILGIVMGGRMYGHYFINSFASTSILVALTIYTYVGFRGAKIVLSLSGLFLIYQIVSYSLLVHRYIDFDKIGRGQDIAQYINSRKTAGDYLYVWDYEPVIYNSTSLPSPSRYTTTVNVADTDQSEGEIGAVILSDILLKKPRYIVLPENQPLIFSQGYNSVKAMVTEQYLLAVNNDGLNLYEKLE